MVRISPKHYLVQLFCLFYLIEYLHSRNSCYRPKTREEAWIFILQSQFHPGYQLLERKDCIFRMLCKIMETRRVSGNIRLWNANVKKKKWTNCFLEGRSTFWWMRPSIAIALWYVAWSHASPIISSSLYPWTTWRNRLSKYHLLHNNTTACTCDAMKKRTWTKATIFQGAKEHRKAWNEHLLEKDLCSVVLLHA